jgi:phosphate:Na+ symporter
MNTSFDIWKMLAGLAIFLLGMKFLEESLQQLAGRPFKLFLKKHTTSKPKAILGGAVVTAVLQSSSVVNLMVLALVGANIIQMQNALAVILGANLGTTLTSWLVATLGFSFNLEGFALPMTGIFGILLSLTSKESLLYRWSKFLFGFGFLFVGLNYIKTGMEAVVQQTDLSLYTHYPPLIFLLIGFILTSLIQSSSATMVITLSALYTNAITLYAATAIALGSEIGTAVKLIIASINGIPAKKRVAWGNILFNSITSAIIFLFLKPVNNFITQVIGINDHLIALVLFQTLVNIFGILLFYPFLNMFGSFLEKRFRQTDDETLFIHKVKVSDTDLALLAVEKEVKHLLFHAIHFTLQVFDRKTPPLLFTQINASYRQKNHQDYYDFLKHLHGNTHQYAIQIQVGNTNNKEITQRLQQLIAANRNALYASKSIKDAIPDIQQLRNSSNDNKYHFYQDAAQQVTVFCDALITLIATQKDKITFEGVSALYESVTKSYAEILHQLYKESLSNLLTEVEISTLINFNREIYTAFKSMVFSAKDFLLDSEQAARFDELPGFIR